MEISNIAVLKEPKKISKRKKTRKTKSIPGITINEAHKKNLVEFYRFSLPDEKIKTQYGVLLIIDWLKKEQERISSKKGRKAEIVHENGEVALFVNDVSLSVENHIENGNNYD